MAVVLVRVHILDEIVISAKDCFTLFKMVFTVSNLLCWSNKVPHKFQYNFIFKSSEDP